ncbi:hypothetical protein TVNIR_0411 [Thioalkalivibrio nitratireducens DSM 14787]|uniref:Uncharacterized protein n=1 Tax=Thioalkalivibrio nitratireducens (strain DSM 14787 / UNIQEM 213 / ALEN2) TaxID=1255043 RepID=L0DUT4_THIND|nr:hypothetical protein TVNIR_0411 [Thioalkalivibrio nitratireducens DSM 14787]
MARDHHPRARRNSRAEGAEGRRPLPPSRGCRGRRGRKNAIGRMTPRCPAPPLARDACSGFIQVQDHRACRYRMQGPAFRG